jgi:uncharacterized protein
LLRCILTEKSSIEVILFRPGLLDFRIFEMRGQNCFAGWVWEVQCQIMGIEDLLRDKRDEILEIAARHGASNVRVFGSVARGEANAQSDIDFLVELERGQSLLDHAGLMVDLENLLGRRVDVATERGLKPRIREGILREAVRL